MKAWKTLSFARKCWMWAAGLVASGVGLGIFAIYSPPGPESVGKVVMAYLLGVPLILAGLIAAAMAVGAMVARREGREPERPAEPRP